LSHGKYDACGVPCIDGAYFDLFQAAAISIGGNMVDVMPIPGASKDLLMSKMAAHRFVQSFVSVSAAKHGVNHIILCNHLCCGAYESLGLSLPEEEALQREHIERARRFLQDQVPMAIRHWLKETEMSPGEQDNLHNVLGAGIDISAFIIKPRDMSKRISDPASECFTDCVF